MSGACTGWRSFSLLTAAIASAALWGGGVSACTSFDAAAEAPPDAAVDAVDAADAARRCDPRASFNAPAPVPSLNEGLFTYGARLSRDELTVYFGSERTGALGSDIWVASRASRDEPFGPAAVVSRNDVSSSMGGEDHPSVSADGRELFFSRLPIGSATVSYDIFRATLENGVFSGAALFVSTDGSDLAPFVASNGDVYFQSNVAKTRSYEILRRPRDGATFGDAEDVAEINSADADGAPVLSDDLLTIYFTSTRPAGGGRDDGKGDVWVAYRASPTATFGEPEHVLALTAPGVDAPSWLSPDNCRLYMTSQRGGSLQTYLATRAPTP